MDSLRTTSISMGLWQEWSTVQATAVRPVEEEDEEDEEEDEEEE